MLKKYTKEMLIELNGEVITEKDYFLDLIENPLVTNHINGSSSIKTTTHWVTIDNDTEILIKVRRR